MNNSNIQHIEFFEEDNNNLNHSFEEQLSADFSYNVNQTQYTETTVYQRKPIKKVQKANNEQDLILQTLLENQKIEKIIDEELFDENLEKSLMTSYLLLRGKSKQILHEKQIDLNLDLQNISHIKGQPKSSQNIQFKNNNNYKSGNIQVARRRNALKNDNQILQGIENVRVIPSCNINWSNFDIQNQESDQKSQFQKQNQDFANDFLRRQQTHENFQYQFSKEFENYATDIDSDESSYVDDKNDLLSQHSNSTKLINNPDHILPQNSTQTNFNEIYNTTSYREQEIQRGIEYLDEIVEKWEKNKIKATYLLIIVQAQQNRNKERQNPIKDLLNIMGSYQKKLKRIHRKIKNQKKKKVKNHFKKKKISNKKIFLCLSIQNITKRKMKQNFRLFFFNQIQQQNILMNEEDRILVKDYFVEDPSIPIDNTELSLLQDTQQYQEFYTKKQKFLMSLKEVNQFYVNTKNWKILLRITCYIFMNTFALIYYLRGWEQIVIFIPLSFVFLQQSFQKLYQEKISDAIQDMCHFALINYFLYVSIIAFCVQSFFFVTLDFIRQTENSHCFKMTLTLFYVLQTFHNKNQFLGQQLVFTLTGLFFGIITRFSFIKFFIYSMILKKIIYMHLIKKKKSIMNYYYNQKLDQMFQRDLCNNILYGITSFFIITIGSSLKREQQSQKIGFIAQCVVNFIILIVLFLVMLFFSIKKTIVVIGDKARESYYRNPLFNDRVIDLEKQMKKKFVIQYFNVDILTYVWNVLIIKYKINLFVLNANINLFMLLKQNKNIISQN